MVGVSAAMVSLQGADETENVWGGEHVAMELTSTGANLDFDCAVGTITEPLEFRRDGTYRAAGTYRRERPGPVTRNGNAAEVPAVYVATIKGNTMELRVMLVKNDETVGTFTLARGDPGHVMKCR
jgi:hypothetical protein